MPNRTEITEVTLTWEEFKQHATAHLQAHRAVVYRGQRDSSWRLQTSASRAGLVRSPGDIGAYFNGILHLLQRELEAATPNRWNLADPVHLCHFLAFAQHNGFPTPLLDWSLSPYIAAYFAFEGVNHQEPQSSFVSIHALEQFTWKQKTPQITDYTSTTPHITFFTPTHVGNNKQAAQQGLFTYSNVSDIEQHIAMREPECGRNVALKYKISTTERSIAVRELALMGVTAVQIAGGTTPEAVCRKVLEDFVTMSPVGPVPENIPEVLSPVVPIVTWEALKLNPSARDMPNLLDPNVHTGGIAPLEGEGHTD
jgi:hypothetical protein